MNDVLVPLLKITLAIFMAGNLLDMGLRLNPHDALRGLRNPRFVARTLIWGFVVGPGLAYGITRVIPLESHYATGLILMGMTPCAPFLPAIVNKAGGDIGYTAAFILLTSAGMIAFMPFAVPLMVEGLTVGAWTIAKPLVMVIALPLAVGMAILHASPTLATKLQPWVKKTTAIATIGVVVLCMVIYGKELLGLKGSLAVTAQVIFFAIVTVLPHLFGFGLRHEEKIVVSVGMSTRNIGAALAPLFSVPGMDERAIIMVVLGFPMMVAFGILTTKLFGRREPTGAM